MKTKAKKYGATLIGLEKSVTKVARSVDKLAAITANGFEHTHKEIKDLKDGQEQIKLRLDNVAYRFELVELQKRVTFLEHKAGVRR